MSAVWMRTRAELRSSWRTWLALALLIGLAGGVAIAAVAGARRTSTAYPRFVAWSRAADLETGGFPDGVDPKAALTKIEHLPSVLAWSRVDIVSYGVKLPNGKLLTLPQMFGISDLQGRFFSEIDRPKVLDGRLPDVAAEDEGVVDFVTARTYGLRVGSVVRPVIGDPFADRPLTAPVRIVGIVAAPHQFPAFGASNAFSAVALTPAFARAHHVEPSPGDATLAIRLRGGPAGLPAFRSQMRRAGLGGVDIGFIQAVRTDGVQRSTRLEAGALWALAAVILLAAGAILGQSLARQTYQSSNDLPILRAVGMSRRQLFSVGLMRATIAGSVGAAVAVVLALGLSPLTPIGLARTAEPYPGFAVDVPVLMAGFVAVLVITVLLAAFPSWRSAAGAGTAREVAPARPSALAGVAAKGSPSPVAGIGVRMALEPGRGRTAVPVRSAIVGATLAVATLMASLVFWSSLQRLIATPRLAGYAWDVFAAPPTGSNGAPVPGASDRMAAILDAEKASGRVAGYTRGGFINLEIGGRSVFGVITGGAGPASPVIVSGRAPAAAHEIALGRASMREARVGIGDTLTVRISNAQNPPPPQRMRVVGEVIMPTAPFGETLVGEGGAVSLAGEFLLSGQSFTRAQAGLPFLIRFRDGVDAQAEIDRLLAKLPQDTFAFASQHRGDITTLGRITRVPLALALLLGLIALGTLAQTLVTSVRARRRDLAILKTLGFSRRQVRGAVAWQAGTLVMVALVIGIPVGLLAGRWIWRAFADGIAVVPLPVLNPAWIVAAVPVTLLLAIAIAAVPGRSAARTKPAMVLRSE